VRFGRVWACGAGVGMCGEIDVRGGERVVRCGSSGEGRRIAMHACVPFGWVWLD